MKIIVLIQEVVVQVGENRTRALRHAFVPKTKAALCGQANMAREVAEMVAGEQHPVAFLPPGLADGRCLADTPTVGVHRTEQVDIPWFMLRRVLFDLVSDFFQLAGSFGLFLSFSRRTAQQVSFHVPNLEGHWILEQECGIVFDESQFSVRPPPFTGPQNVPVVAG
mmetsp:Transcript_15370/g.16957  ORF Transcript_15370/g.16957 Transcript_15370/m.16957 type:complete len:166 (+) Transcript_15370:135-632(+)